MTHTISRYDADTPLPPEVAEQMVTLFKDNYPASHSETDRTKDLDARKSPEAVNALLADGRVIFVAQNTHDKVLGLLEMSEVDQGQGIYMQLYWIIVDALARGTGLARQLHDAFEQESRDRAARTKKKSCMQLAVHKDNAHAIAVYQSWGYTQWQEHDGKVDMFKDFVSPAPQENLEAERLKSELNDRARFYFKSLGAVLTMGLLPSLYLVNEDGPADNEYLAQARPTVVECMEILTKTYNEIPFDQMVGHPDCDVLTAVRDLIPQLQSEVDSILAGQEDINTAHETIRTIIAHGNILRMRLNALLDVIHKLPGCEKHMVTVRDVIDGTTRTSINI